MSKKKIIIATPHLWDSPYKVGSHQYAKCFSDDGWDIAFISSPVTPFHMFYHFISSQGNKLHIPERLNSWLKGGKQSDNVWSYVPFGLLPIANKFIFDSRWAIRNAYRFLIPSLKSKLKENGFEKVHTIWFDSPIFAHLLDIIPHEKSVLRVADDLSGLPGASNNVIEAEKELARKVDLVVVTARSLEQKFRDIGVQRILYLPNGVDFGHFAYDPNPEPEDLKGIPLPRIIYVGVLEKWFNEKWVEHAASHRKDTSFIIIGPHVSGTFPTLEQMQNVFFLGKRDYTVVPSYLKQSQVGIIPFKQMPFINSVNPIKLYEYMACGLPVVSTKWKTLEEMASPALLAENEEDFLQKIEKALQIKNEIGSSCVKFANENSWSKRFNLVKEHL